MIAALASALLEGLLLMAVIGAVGGPVAKNGYARAVLVSIALTVVLAGVGTLFGPLALVVCPVAYVMTLMAAYDMPPLSAVIVGLMMAVVKFIIVGCAFFMGFAMLGLGALLTL